MERVRDHAQRPERLTSALTPPVTFPSHDQVLGDLARAERAEGWMARCDDEGRFVALTSQFVDALAAVLLKIATNRPVLEVCAGDGSLAAALRGKGISIIATDVSPPPHAVGVQRLAAREALRRHDPEVVLGCFVPCDAGVDRAVLGFASVTRYVVLNARLGGEVGASCLWTDPAWKRKLLPAVTAQMISRHDVWLGDEVPPYQQGEAWILTRKEDPAHGSPAPPEQLG